MSERLDMSVEFAGLRLKNPVIAASGTFGYGLEWESILDLNELGGLVTKGLSREPMAGNPPPRLAVTPTGMLNFIGLQNVGVDAFIRDKLPRLARFRTAVIANVFGKSVEDYVEVVRRLEDAEGLAAYELNLSSPNSKGGGMVFGSDVQLLGEVTAAVRKVCQRPLLVKLLLVSLMIFSSGNSGKIISKHQRVAALMRIPDLVEYRHPSLVPRHRRRESTQLRVALRFRQRGQVFHRGVEA